MSAPGVDASEFPAGRFSVFRTALALIGLGLDLAATTPVALTLAGAGPQLDLARLLALHGGAALASSVAFLAPGGGHRAPALAPLMLVLVLWFPVLGPLAAVWALLASASRAKAARSLLEDYRELVDARGDPVAQLEETPDFWERTWRSLDLAAFDQVLATQREGDVIASAFESALKLERPIAARMFRHALSSRVPLTRYYASTALARFEEQCDRELQAAEAAHKAAPEDPDQLLRLAAARLAYADITEAEDAVTKFHVQESIRLNQHVLELLAAGGRPGSDPRELVCRERLARAMLLLSDVEGARTHFQLLVERGSREVSVLVGAAEVAFRSGDYPGLVRTLAAARERCQGSELIDRLAHVWLPVATTGRAAPLAAGEGIA